MSFSKGATPKGVQNGPAILDASAIRTFKIAHQRISLDVDLSTHSIRGTADIILIPLIQNLAFITLDCKAMKIKDVLVENRRCENYIHDDAVRTYSQKYTQNARDPLFEFNSIEQSHFFREKFADLNEFPEEKTKSQLTIKIPPSIKITLQDANSLTNFTPITPSIRGTPAQDTVFTPISIRIEYEVNNPSTGVRFDTISETQQHLWNVYTTNSELCCTASYWMPCVNMLDEKCTWEVEISVPRKVKDIGTSKIIGQQENISRRLRPHKQSEMDLNRNYNDISDNAYTTPNDVKQENEKKVHDQEDEEEDDEYEMLDEEDENNTLNKDIQVCCCEFSTAKETSHPTDLTKKLFSFQIFNPVAPHHVGWAIGAFDIWVLPPLQQHEETSDDEQDENDESKKLSQKFSNEMVDDTENNDIIPIQVYTLPQGDIDEKTVLNTTIVSQKIMDFYSKEFGSYPFASYSIVFLPTLVDPTMDFAGMTLSNTRLLYPPEMIDSMFTTTNHLAWALATQWSGVNITPLEMNNIWCCLGIAGYMVFQLTKKLFGSNELRYRLKMAAEKIVDQDWEKPPIGSAFTNSSRPISYTSKDLDFIKLKAPMVMFILDRRMIKTERSFGMSRVLPKIFLQAMSGDLANNSLSASHFQYVCERVNRSKLEAFFQQWVYGSGVPIFRVTQRFNKKRMMVEMGIRQCQAQELGQDKVLGAEGFCSSALNYKDVPSLNRTPFFTGSMTIRIHEADGTPYEHIVELKDVFTKLDIQYNTKYRKLRNKRIQATKSSNKSSTPDLMHEALSAFSDKSENGPVHKLGNVLSSSDELDVWNLVDVSVSTDGNESQRQNEAFEWIRIDSDFEWICKIYVNQADYMFTSQLQQDSDVEAQVESLRYFEDVIVHASDNSQIYSSILTRTAMDKRYFYGVRLEACRALARFIVRDHEPKNFSGGPRHLIHIFRALFCYKDSNVPLSNDFTNFQNYFIQKGILKYLKLIKNERNETPEFVKHFLLDILTYNENSENAYDDSHYLCALIDAVVDCAIRNPTDENYLTKVIEQLRRYQNLEKWTPTYQFLVKKEVISAKLRLTMSGLYELNELNEIIGDTLEEETQPTNLNVPRLREGSQDITLCAFKLLLVVGGMKNKEALKYFFETLCFTPNVYLRDKMVDVLFDAIDFIAVNKLSDRLDDDIDYLVNKINPEDLSLDNLNGDSAIVEEDTNRELKKRQEEKLKTTIRGLMQLLTRQFKSYDPLKTILWGVLRVPGLSLYQKKRLFDLSRILYPLLDSFEVVLPMPRDKKLVASYDENNKVVIKREGLLKVHIPSNIKINVKSNENVNQKPNFTTVTVPSNKVKITLNKPTTAKPKKVVKPPSKLKQAKGTVNRVGVLPLRFVKLSIAEKKKVDISSTPFSKNVQIIKANSRSFTLKILLPKKNNQIGQ